MIPEELDEARAKEAERICDIENSQSWTLQELATIAARLARENWTPPEPVDPDVLAFRDWATTLWPNVAEGVLHGNMDYTEAAKGFLAGARMAREQERERAKGLVKYVWYDAKRPGGEGNRAREVLAKYEGTL